MPLQLVRGFESLITTCTFEWICVVVLFVLPQSCCVIGLEDTFITLFDGLMATFLEVMGICGENFVTALCALLKVVYPPVCSHRLLVLTVPVTEQTRPLSLHQYFIVLIMTTISADRMKQLCVHL